MTTSTSAPHAIILAAGRGSRMGTLTDDRPKCLVELAGKPLLHWQLVALRHAGISDITVVRGYCADRICEPDVNYIDNAQWASANMVRSLCCADPILSAQTCIVSYSDIAYHNTHIRSLIDAPDVTSGIALTYDLDWQSLWTQRFDDPLTDAETFVQRGGCVVEIGNRPTHLTQVQGQYMGLLRLTPEGWAQVRACLAQLDRGAIDRLDMTSLLKQLIAAGVVIQSVAVLGRWVEVDSLRDLQLYERCCQLNGWSHDWRP